MPTKVVFADKESEDAFWAANASNQRSHKSGKHPSVRLVSTQPINRSSASYPVRSLFAKFNTSMRRRKYKYSGNSPRATQPKPTKPKWWWSRRSSSNNKRGTSKSFADRTIVSPFEEMSLYGFITPVDCFEDNDDDSPPVTVTELQEWHDDRVTNDAMYMPWAVSYGIDRSARDLHELQEKCVPDTTSVHSPWDDKPVLAVRERPYSIYENKTWAFRPTAGRRYRRKDTTQ
jgi:hypothetical protein